MSGLLADMPVGGVAVAIFALRLLDVTLGTIRTLSIVNGRQRTAFVLGFIEVSIWLTAVAEAIARVGEDPFLIPVFAAGFATGNAVGIEVERRLALGVCIVRLISKGRGLELTTVVGQLGKMVTAFTGTGTDGQRTLIYAMCPRRDVPALLDRATEIDGDVFYAIDRFSETRQPLPTFQPTGWRSVLKKK